MLYESETVRVGIADGIATLSFGFPGSGINPLGPCHLEDIGRGLAAIIKKPGIQGLVIRSHHPLGFCSGTEEASLLRCEQEQDRAEYAQRGQAVLSAIAQAPWPTLAFIHGPCLGPGLELALACTFRFAVASVDSHFGFPLNRHNIPPCWGIQQRLNKPQRKALLQTGSTFSARQALQLGLVDGTVCSRNANVELQRFIDKHLRAKRIPQRKALTNFANERRQFISALRQTNIEKHIPWVTLPQSAKRQTPVAVLGTISQQFAEILAGAAIRGSTVTFTNEANVTLMARALDAYERRGYINPLEKTQAQQRCIPGGTLKHAEIVFVTNSDPYAIDGLEGQIKPTALCVSLSGRLETLQGQFLRTGRTCSLGLPLPRFGSHIVDVGLNAECDLFMVHKLETWLSEQQLEAVFTQDKLGLSSRRTVCAWLDEAIRMVSEGVAIEDIDHVAKAAGFALPPLATLDELGFEGWGLRRLLPLRAVGLNGRNGGEGFYTYTKRPTPNLAAASLLWDARLRIAIGEAAPLPLYDTITEDEIADRLLLRTLNEAMDVATLPGYCQDKAIALGTGFFAQSGGPTHYLASRGFSPTIRRMATLAVKFGPRFNPSPGLVKYVLQKEIPMPGLAAAG